MHTIVSVLTRSTVYYASVTKRMIHCRSCWNVGLLISWPWSTACSAWTHVWYTNAICYQSSRLS